MLILQWLLDPFRADRLSIPAEIGSKEKAMDVTEETGLLVRPGGFEPPAFCSGGSWSHYESITYIAYNLRRPRDFSHNSALFAANWWGNWWGSHRLAIRALTRVAISHAIASESHTHVVGGPR